MTDYAAARLAMVESQLRTNKVTDEAVLDAFLTVPRERFVPPHLRGTAYVDGDLPLGGGRCMMQPMVLARLLQLAEITRQDTVLEIGCGTGYGTALLARLARAVVAIDSEIDLARQAVARLRELAIDNAAVIEAPLTAGYPARAPYRVMICQGAVARVPPALAEQLAEGGRLVCVLQQGSAPGRAVVMTSAGGVLSHWPAFDATVPLLPGFEAQPSFVF